MVGDDDRVIMAYLEFPSQAWQRSGYKSLSTFVCLRLPEGATRQQPGFDDVITKTFG